jgi:hypothetical protein
MSDQVKRVKQVEAKGRAAHAAAKAAEGRTGEEMFTFSCDRLHRWVDDFRCSRHRGVCPVCGGEAS